MDAALRDAVDVMARVASRDFSRKPPIVEGDDPFSQFLIGFRFMIEDLERAHRDLEAERAQLEDANRRLRALDRAKTQLINSAAHELGTPLTPIKLQMHLLKSRARTAEYAELRPGIEMVDRNIARLEVLVRDMLDVARLESDRLDLRRERADVAALAREAFHAFEPQAKAAGIGLTLVGPPAAVAEVDGTRIVQVLFNLLSNALKFTPRGGSVSVRVAAGPSSLSVDVVDTGIGVDPREASALFKPFSQLQDALRSRGGTGLGLYICRGIVEQHGGQIRCESAGRNRGSMFSFTVPLKAAAAARTAYLGNGGVK